MRIQWLPNVILQQRRICLTRLRWERGVVGDGHGYSAKLSISLCWKLQDMWIGVFWRRHDCNPTNGWLAWFCLLPCLPIRLSYQRSYGGTFP
jgi:hypothetical protein